MGRQAGRQEGKQADRQELCCNEDATVLSDAGTTHQVQVGVTFMPAFSASLRKPLSVAMDMRLAGMEETASICIQIHTYKQVISKRKFRPAGGESKGQIRKLPVTDAQHIGKPLQRFALVCVHGFQ